MPEQNSTVNQPEAAMVLYCLLRRKEAGEKFARFLLLDKQGYPTFPPTKFRPGEDLYHALVRPLEEDLGLPPGSYFPEEELPMIPSAGESPRYPGLSKQWSLYPVVVSLTKAGWARLAKSRAPLHWLTIGQLSARSREPNVRKIADALRTEHAALLREAPTQPSMDALACCWSAAHAGGVRVVRSADLRRILGAGTRAFNLRVADPYLPYQKQGLGFTWSFFTPHDTQDVHVHGLPAVEIYGVLEGRLQLWHKPMNERGVRTWRCELLGKGDWAEVESLHCHLAGWITPTGLGTVIKAAGSGELAGVGKLGVAGKTTCQHCNVHQQCLLPPALSALLEEYGKPYGARNLTRIAELAQGAVTA